MCAFISNVLQIYQLSVARLVNLNISVITGLVITGNDLLL